MVRAFLPPCVCRLCDRSFQFVLVVCLFVCLNRSGVFCTGCTVGISNLLKQIVFVCLFVCLNRSSVFCMRCAVGVSNLLKQIVFVCLFV